MSVKTDVVNLRVNVGDDKAQNQLNNLRKSAADLKFEMDGLNKRTKEYAEKKKQLADINNQMAELKKTIGLSALSQKELNKELKTLTALRNSVVPFSDEYKKLDGRIKQVKDRLYEVNNGVRGFSATFSKIKDEVKQFGMLAAGYLGFQFITSSFQNIINTAGKLSDKLADVQRAANLTKEEASALSNSLGQLDTRTGKGALLDLALVAAKLGIAKDEIVSFTAALDQLVVALGNELGDAESVATQLGKILNVFEGKVTADGITKLGNAFVELANAGVASGGFIADFTQRVSGIAASSNLSLGAVVGLAAALEEMGGRSESSSTAIQKILFSIASDIPKAAKVAKMSVAEFNNEFANRPQEALLRYAQGLVKNKQSFAEVTASFKDAGEEGARVVETISKLGNATDFVRKKIELGTEAIQRSNAITDAFAIKNENLGAQIDKLGKAIAGAFQGSRMQAFISALVQGLTDLITPARTAVDIFKEQQQVVNKLEKDVVPLLARYDELKAKTTLNKDEQVELNKTIQLIGATIPTAISGFDKYGRALDINRGKALEFIKLQKLILQERNRDAIKEQQNLLQQLEREAAAQQRVLNAGRKEVYRTGSSTGVGISSTAELTGPEILARQRQLAETQARIAGVRGIIAELNGEAIEAATQLANVEKAANKAADAAAPAVPSSSSTSTTKTQKTKAPKIDSFTIWDQLQVRAQTQKPIQFPQVKITPENLENVQQEYSALIEDFNQQLDRSQRGKAAALELRVMMSKGRERLEAQKALLLQQTEMELQNTELVEEEKELIRAKYRQGLVELEQEYWQGIMDRVAGIGQFINDSVIPAFQAFYNLKNALDLADFNKEKKLNDQKRNLYKKQLDGKLLSQAQFDRKIQELDAAEEARKKEMDRKAFERQKKIQIAQTIMNGAQAIVSILAQYPKFDFGVAASIAMGVAAVTTALQVATIAKQQPPEMGRGALLRNGPKHNSKSRGLPIINPETGQVEALVERGEAVMSAAAMDDGSVYEVRGTTRQITSALNGRAGGRTWAGGAVVRPIGSSPNWVSSTGPSIRSNMPAIMADGGTIKTSSTNNNDASLAMMENIVAELRAQRVEMQQWKDRLHAVVSIKEFRDTERIYEQAKSQSGL